LTTKKIYYSAGASSIWKNNVNVIKQPSFGNRKVIWFWAYKTIVANMQMQVEAKTVRDKDIGAADIATVS